ncbi:hypothetical protein AAEX28_07055 [Lentisphaerota bacterium WC36G]|nr:hypothetical protein LJT99_09920 [Lentisphaerae bacterium WC36]UDQ98967.1 hypothetical protein LJT99_05375 [Lentisphaerae bacterium WC36]
MYQNLNDHQILRLEDNAIIPICEDNSDYQKFQLWVAEGNSALEPPIEEIPSQTVFTKLEIRRAFRTLNKESVLDELLASNTEFAKDWADANEIDLNDPITAQALEIINNADNGVTIENIINQITN